MFLKTPCVRVKTRMHGIFKSYIEYSCPVAAGTEHFRELNPPKF